jgi:photosystem II stability/assembly factor-like uncharacterized protein
LVLLFSIIACEAPLILDEVEKARQAYARRTDTFLAIGANANDIVVVGSHGVVLVSNNDGETWQRQELGGWPALIDATACTNGSLAALSFEGDVWVSEDKGSSWQARKLGTEESPQAIRCDSRNQLWVVGAFSTISSSTDLGKTWSLSTTDEDIILNNIQFISDNKAFISGEFGTLMRSIDAGETWETLAPIRENFYPQDMHFDDPLNGWVVGLEGMILNTKDGGQTWTKQESHTFVSLFRLSKSDEHLFTVGGEGTILRLSGNDWVSVDHGQDIRLYIGGIESLHGKRIIVTGPVGTLHILAVEDIIARSNEIPSVDHNASMEG